jgi:hypothetical protein
MVVAEGVSAILPQSYRSFNSLVIGRKSYPQTNLHFRGNRAEGRVTFVEERGGSTTPTAQDPTFGTRTRNLSFFGSDSIQTG